LTTDHSHEPVHGGDPDASHRGMTNLLAGARALELQREEGK
jgi:hypothetical protein